MASTAAASSSSARSPAVARLAFTLFPSIRRLWFSRATAFFVNDLANFHFLKYVSAGPIGGVASMAENCVGELRTDDTCVPPVKHLVDNGARVFSHLVRKKVEDMTYRFVDGCSKSRLTPLSRVPGCGTASVTLISYRSFCSRPSNLNDSQGPAAIDYRYVLQEDEFHKLADSTIHDLLEKLEEYGDSIDIDGFDIDYGNEVLTLKLGNLGTYVVNKQTPNRQIWLSSPVSGPSRFDWDPNTQAWIYRRNQANLFKVLESEIEKLCGQPLSLS